MSWYGTDKSASALSTAYNNAANTYSNIARNNGAGATANALGKSMAIFGELNEEFGKNRDADTLAQVQKSDIVSMDDVSLYDSANTSKIESAINANKTEADNNVLAKVLNGEIEKESVPTVYNPQTQSNINAHFKVQEAEELEKRQSLSDIKALELISTGDMTAKEVFNQFKDDNGRSTLSKQGLANLVTKMNLEDKQKFQLSLNAQNREYDAKLKQQEKANTQDNSLDKNIETGIVNQKNPDKIVALKNIKTQLQNGDISKNDFEAQRAELAKEPLDSSVVDQFNKRKQYLETVNKLLEEHQSGNLAGNVGYIDSLTPNIGQRANRVGALQETLMLGKTDQLKGTLSDKDMQILRTSGINDAMGIDDYVSKLKEIKTGLTKSIGNDYKEYADKFDIPENINNISEYINSTPKAKQRKSVVSPQAKTVVKTGKDASGKKVVQYSDGSIEYAN